MAYNIIELNEKLTTELRVLAKEMGIRRPDAYKKEELIYKILDEQAIAETKKLSPESGNPQGYTPRRGSDNKTNNQRNKTANRKEEPKEKGADKKEDKTKPLNQSQSAPAAEKPKLVRRESSPAEPSPKKSSPTAIPPAEKKVSAESSVKESSPAEKKTPAVQNSAPSVQSEVKPAVTLLSRGSWSSTPFRKARYRS